MPVHEYVCPRCGAPLPAGAPGEVERCRFCAAQVREDPEPVAPESASDDMARRASERAAAEERVERERRSAEAEMRREAARSGALFDGTHRVGGVMLLVFAIGCLGSAIYLAVYGVTPSVMRYVGGLHADNAPNVVLFLVVMGGLNGGIAVKMFARPKRR